MKDLKGRKILITGASSGIGKAIAYKFSELGSDLILIARRKDRLEKISEELRNKSGIKVLIIETDVRNFMQVKNAVESLTDEWKNIDVLVNNAGLARGLSNVYDGSAEDWDEMIDTNVKGLLYVSRAVIPLMIKNNSGHIINIGSIAGREVYPKGNVYCATKHAVDAITKGIRMELADTPIKVSTIDPGLVETEFSLVRYRGDKEKAKKTYEGIKALTPEEVSEAVIFAATRNENFVVAEMVLLPKAQASTMVISRK